MVSQACQAGKVKGTPDETALCKSSSCVMTMQVFKDEKVIEGLDGYYGICFTVLLQTVGSVSFWRSHLLLAAHVIASM